MDGYEKTRILCLAGIPRVQESKSPRDAGCCEMMILSVGC